MIDVTVEEGADLDARGERCGVSEAVLAQLGLFSCPPPEDLWQPGYRRQVRLVSPLNADHDALCTLAGLVASQQLALGPIARRRALALTPPERFPATLDTDVLNPHLVELLDLRAGRWLAVLAPHGGDIERRTDRQAEQVAQDARLAARVPSLWRCLGTGGDAFERWHITSTDISEHSFPGLGRLAACDFEHLVAFHGYAVDPKPGTRPLDVIIGGLAAAALREGIRDEIRKALPPRMAETIDLAPAGHPFGASEPENLVNRLARAGGVQIEQSAAARAHWQDVATAVAGALAAAGA